MMEAHPPNGDGLKPIFYTFGLRRRGPLSNDKLSETDGTTESVYGEIIWDITDQWQLDAGIRYIRENKDSCFLQPYVAPYSFFPIFFTQYNPAKPSTPVDDNPTWTETVPEVTLRWTPREKMMFYAAYKEGFKSGGFSNSGILGNISGTVEDFAFEPEHVKGGEIGIKMTLLDGTLGLSLEAYHYKFEDLQVDFFNSQQFAYVTENAGGSITSGAELQADWATPVEGLIVAGSIGYLQSEFTTFENFCYVGQTPAQGCGPLLPGQNEAQLRQDLDGNTRPGAPEWSGYLSANYERQITNSLLFGITANVQFKSETVLSASDPNAVYGAYEIYDANIRVFTVDGKWEAALIGKNLSDELAIRSSANVPETGGNTGTPGGFRGDLRGDAIRGRQVELELTYKF